MAFETFNVKAILQGSVTGTEQFDRFGSKLNSIGKTADTVNKQMAGLQSAIRGLASAFGGVQLASLAAEFARATIQIDAFQKQLSIGFGEFNVIELEKLRNTMRGLGIAQDEALGSAVRFTSALKLSGQSMADANTNFEAASKLILSNKLSADGANRVYYAMAQIASKGKLMSEELNGQLGDVLAGFSQQVAREMNMSTAQLAKAMQDGKVSAQDFFNALQKIGDGIDPTKLDSAAMSLGKLKNAWFDFKTSVIDIGIIKSSLDLVTSGLIIMKDNAEVLATAVKGLAIGFASIYGARLLAPVFLAISTAAKAIALEVALAGSYLRAFGASATFTAAASINASRALGILAAAGRGVMGLFGGPIGIALTAAATGMYAFYTASKEAEDGLLASAKAAEELGVTLNSQAKAAITASREQSSLGSATSGAEPAVWSYKNATDSLTLSLYEQAKAARAARVELLQSQIADREKAADRALYGTAGGRDLLRIGRSEAFKQGDLLTVFGNSYEIGKGKLANILSGGRTDRENMATFMQESANLGKLERDLEVALTTPIGKSDLPTGAGRAPTPAASTKTRTPKGPTPVQIEKTFENMRDEYTQGALKAQRELTNTIEARYLNQKDALESDIKAKASDIAAAKGLSNAQRETLTLELAKYTQAKMALLEAQKADEMAKQANELKAISATADVDILRMQESMAATAAERKEIQKKILAAEIALQLAKEDEVINSKTASEEEKAQARARRAAIQKVGETQGQQVDYQNRDAVQTYGATLIDTATKFKEAWASALKGTEDALVNFVMTGKLSFKDLANSIISDMVRIAIQQAIIKPLMTAFGFKFAMGGVFEGGSVKKFATGGVVTGPTMFPMSGGRMGMMGEAGPEAIMPLRRLGNGRLGVEAHGGGTQNVAVTVNVEGGQSQVQGDAGKAAQLGQLVAQAVRNELVVQKRPGGLLAAA